MTEKQIKHAQRVRQKLAIPITLLNILKDRGFVYDELVKKALMDTRLTIRISISRAEQTFGNVLSKAPGTNQPAHLFIRLDMTRWSKVEAACLTRRCSMSIS